MQFWMGHVPLNKYLFRIGKLSSPICPTCKQGEKSTHHYLVEYITWRYERWHMGKELGNAARSADCMLNSRKGVKQLLRFVGQTARFKQVFGDVPQLS